MRIIVLGGTGLIGRQVIDLLRADGHDAVAASPSTGVDVLADTGLDEAFDGADVVVDVTNAPSFDEETVVRFFGTGTTNALAAEKRVGVGHHVALSIVGMDAFPAVGYMAGKLVQEAAIRDGGVPYSIVRATQFFEFLPTIAAGGTVDDAVVASPRAMQPVAAAAVARAVAAAAVKPAAGAVTEIGGPEVAPISTFLDRYLRATGDDRAVKVDVDAGYFGIDIDDRSLVTSDGATIDALTLDDWLASGR